VTGQEYDAYVYDLDGTLVTLDVDWDDVADEVAAVLRARGIEVPDADLWAMLERSNETGYRRKVDETIAEFEREGARTAEKLVLADALPHEIPVGVCSLNSESACRIALETYGLDSAVDFVVGRDSVATEKPHPEPLLRTVDGLGVSPERTLFIGDSERDYETAENAGTAFVYANRWQDMV